MTPMSLLALGGLLLTQPRFTEVSEAAGVAHLQHAAHDAPDCLYANGSFCEPERMTGAVAVGDYDGDGLDDLYFTVLDGRDRLFRNLGDGGFAEAGLAAGLGAMVASNGATWFDADRDGDLDLYVTSLATRRFHLYINDGGRFSEEAEARGADLGSEQPHFGWSVGAGDYDRDGWVDLVVGEWFASFVIQGEARAHVAVLRNLGAEDPGRFEVAHDVESLGLDALSNDGVWAFAPSFVDIDGDGWQDLLFASDFHTSRLFWNDREGGFVDGTDAAGVGTDENGMGSAVADFDGDGLLDWFVTSIFDADRACDRERCGWEHDGNRLYRNLGDRRFEDVTDAAGVREGFWGWGTVFFDADNDGDLDLVMTNGVQFPRAQVDAPFNEDPMRFWRNDGEGRMVEMAHAAGLRDTGSGKGLATLDYDGDGDLDLVITRNASTPLLYRNDTEAANGWLRVRLSGRASNREGLGARITLRPSGGGPEQVRAMNAQSFFLGQSERVAHFGVGQRERVDVTVRWPAGGSETARCLEARQTLLWVEGAPPADGVCPPSPDGGVDAALPEPDASLPDAGSPDADLDAAARDVSRPDAAVLDARTPDAAVPEAAVADSAGPDVSAPDAAVPDAAVRDAAVPDAFTGDARLPDVIAPDLAVVDASAQDGAPIDVPDAWPADSRPVDGPAPDARTDGPRPDVTAPDGVPPPAPDAAADLALEDGPDPPDETEPAASSSGCDCRAVDGPAMAWWALLVVGLRRRRLAAPPRRRAF